MSRRRKKKRSIHRPRRGDLYYANLDPVVGSEQGGIRPVLVIQNDAGNQYSPTLVAAITSRQKPGLPTHVLLTAAASGLDTDSCVLLEQFRTLDKTRFLEYVGHIGPEVMAQIDSALALSIGLNKIHNAEEKS